MAKKKNTIKKFTQSENNGKCKITMNRYVNLLNVGNGRRRHHKHQWTKKTCSGRKGEEREEGMLHFQKAEQSRVREREDSFLRFYLFNGAECWWEWWCSECGRRFVQWMSAEEHIRECAHANNALALAFNRHRTEPKQEKGTRKKTPLIFFYFFSIRCLSLFRVSCNVVCSVQCEYIVYVWECETVAGAAVVAAADVATHKRPEDISRFF